MFYRILVCLGAALILSAGMVQAAARELASEGDLVRLVLEKPFSCGKPVEVTIRAKSADYFDQSPMVIQRLVNTSSAILGFECAAISHLNFVGYTDNLVVFKASAKKGEKWALQTEPPPLEALALVYGLYEPHFFHLAQIHKLLEPYQRVTGMKATYQYTALMQQIGRLKKTINGDMDQFKAYLVNPGQDFAVYEEADQNYNTILSAIQTFAPEQYPLYQQVYDEYATTLKDAFWSAKLEEMINAGDTVGDSIEAAQTVIQHDPSGEFTQYIDAELAKWIHEETSLIKNDFPNAGLYEVAWSADFIVGFPDPSNLSALPQTKKQIEDANTTLVSGINTAIQRLNKLAIESIMASGTSYDEVDIILDSGFSLAENFEAAGFTEQSEQLLGETISYIETIIETGLNGFKAELEKTEFSAQQVADLQQQASAFDDLSKQFSGFSAYKQAIETVLETNKATICKNLLLDSGAGKSDFEKPIMIGGETLSLAELNCNLYEQGSSIARISSKFLSDTYDISIANSDGAVSEYRFKTDKTLANQALSVRSTITESEEQPISQEQWSEFISSLVQPPPSGEPDTNGVRECDLLAADPHDPQKLSPGIDFTTDDIDLDAFERGIDACIAAVEHDPEDARQIYQLGRLLWYAGDQEMAKDYIEVAAQANYAPAIYYNAEMMLSLSDDPDAFIDALELYETSGKLGYARGSDMVRELNPDGIEFFKEIPPPTGAEIVASLKQKGKSVSVFGMTTSVRVVDAKIKDCFQTSATDFSCEYKKIAKCGVSGWGNDPMVGFLSRAMQSDCNGAPYTFGSFRKLAQGSWKELPSQF